MNTFETKLAGLSEEARGWLLGTKSANPLGCAFTKKRVVHPGAGGKRMIMDKAEQTRIWAELMNAAPNPADERSVYIHIPFCDKKCSYCGFFQNFTREEAAHHYVDVLLDELDAAADTPYVQGAPFQAVFFGGGTPTALSDADLSRLVRTVRERLPLTSDCEITLEGRIHDLSESKVEAAMNAGINRFSLGVQSFDTRVRQSIGRIDDRETVIETLRRMVEKQGAVVIADLIYGLPYQSMEIWENDVRTQFELGIAGGDLYQLNVFPGSELARRIDAGDLPMLPTTEEQAEYFKRGLEIVAEYPMARRIDTTHWTTDHRERSIYNTLAKRGNDVLAFGSGAGGVGRAIRPWPNAKARDSPSARPTLPSNRHNVPHRPYSVANHATLVPNIYPNRCRIKPTRHRNGLLPTRQMLGQNVLRRLPCRCGHFQTAILHHCANAIVRQPNNGPGFPQLTFPLQKPAYFLPPHAPPKPDDGAYNQPAGHTMPKQPYFL